MGEVVQMQGWRDRKMSERRERRTSKGGPRIPYEAVIQIQELLFKSEQAMREVHHLGTVRLREQSVINSMKHREDADKIAKEHGVVIVKDTDGNYTLRLKE